MRVAYDHFFATVSDPLLDYLNRRSCHDQSAHSVVPEGVHTFSLHQPSESRDARRHGGCRQAMRSTRRNDGSDPNRSFQFIP